MLRPRIHHIWVVGNQVGLFLGQPPHRGLGVVAGLAEGHLHQVAAHALGQGKQGGEHHGGEQDRQNCHQIRPRLVRNIRFVNTGMGRKIDCFFILFAPLLCHNPSILNADHTVCHCGQSPGCG